MLLIINYKDNKSNLIESVSMWTRANAKDAIKQFLKKIGKNIRLINAKEIKSGSIDKVQETIEKNNMEIAKLNMKNLAKTNKPKRKSFKIFDELVTVKEMLYDTPSDVKSAFNNVVEYFAKGSSEVLKNKDTKYFDHRYFKIVGIYQGKITVRDVYASNSSEAISYPVGKGGALKHAKVWDYSKYGKGEMDEEIKAYKKKLEQYLSGKSSGKW